ncbi:DUF58 domain-containing protein [Thermoflexibacter ruber]|uniref:DUF58 domain-containing protein n=1 Tax=Thermoflexibacter ruber TaxID=1003 RepID=A0A1I2AX05_9BACT|nr:DUF58 domain-containing protein [Thermoflexibacter ruber]SFE48494.1 Protein of unknown function DUF58 [Thermoflexibacter ruber]
MPIDLSKVKEYSNIEMLAKQMVEGFITGLHKSPYHGFSVEFAEHRLYNTGESTRHIDWKVYAKTDRLYTKRYEEETNLRCQILIDNSSSMYYPEKTYGKIRFSIMAAACLAYMLQKQRDAVGISTFSEEIEWQSPVKSTPSHIHNLFVKLQQLFEQVPQYKKTSAAQVIHQIADKIHKRSLVIIFSDMLENTSQQEELFSALQHLKHNQHEVLLFHVVDEKTELNFEFAERPYEFIDLETNEKVKIHPNQIKEYYKENIVNKFQRLKLRCGQYKIDFIEADIGKSIDQILLPYLIKRQKMK